MGQSVTTVSGNFKALGKKSGATFSGIVWCDKNCTLLNSGGNGVVAGSSGDWAYVLPIPVDNILIASTWVCS